MYLQAQERGLCYHREEEALFAWACMASFGVRTHFVWSRCSNFCNDGNALRPETVTQGHLHSQCHPRRMLGKNKLEAGYRPELGLWTNHRCEKRPAISHFVLCSDWNIQSPPSKERKIGICLSPGFVILVTPCMQKCLQKTRSTSALRWRLAKVSVDRAGCAGCQWNRIIGGERGQCGSMKSKKYESAVVAPFLDWWRWQFGRSQCLNTKVRRLDQF